MAWKVKSTKTFSKQFKKFKKNQGVLEEFDKKIKVLIQKPYKLRGNLSEKLEGKNLQSCLISIDSDSGNVYLEDINHRQRVYDWFLIL